MTELGDLLAAAGYSSGNTLPVHSIGTQSSVNDTISSDTYSTAQNLLMAVVQWDDIIPSDAQGRVALGCRIIPGGTTGFCQVRQSADADNLTNTEVSASSDSLLWSGWVDYTPTTTSSPVKFTVRIKNEDNSTSVDIRNVNVALGVKL